MGMCVGCNLGVCACLRKLVWYENPGYRALDPSMHVCALRLVGRIRITSPRRRFAVLIVILQTFPTEKLQAARIGIFRS